MNRHIGRFRCHDGAAIEPLDELEATLLTPGALVISRSGQEATVMESLRVDGVQQYKINGQWVRGEDIGDSQEMHKPWRRYLSAPEANDALDAELLAPGDVVISKTGQQAKITETRLINGFRHYRINGQWVSGEHIGNSRETDKLWRRSLGRDHPARIATAHDWMPDRLRDFARFLTRHYSGGAR